VSKHQGFATMTPEQRQAIARLGGKAAHALGTAHRWTREEAVWAGSKGGTTTKQRKDAARRENTTHD
jgi:uncharacterized protein